MSPKLKKRLTFAGIAFVGMILFILASMQWTSRSEFCNSCHYMEPFYQAWQHSSHSDVACIICHYEPGIMSTFRGKIKGLEQLFMYATQSYLRSKPWAEIPDASCLRSGCHEKRLLLGEVEFKEGILFDHRPHLLELRRGKKLRCTSCHSQIVQGEHMTVTASTCFLCHFKGLGAEASPSCTQCHDAPVATPEQQVSYDHTMIIDRDIDCRKCHGEMVVGDGAVPTDNCEDCHFEQAMLDQYGDTEKIHVIHITEHKLECQRCHLAIQHKSVSRSAEVKPACQSCHPDFHETQAMLFRGQGGRHVADHPSPMYTGGLNCQGCHIFHQTTEEFAPGGETVMASDESCEYCHGPGYSELVEAWNDSTEKRLKIIETSIERVEHELTLIDTTGGIGRQAAGNLRDAKFNYQLVEYGKSVHNITYADVLLQESRSLLITALDQIGSGYRLPPYPWTDQIIPGECASCHEGVEDEVIETADGLRFDHGVHLNADSLSCRNCHSNMRRHGEMVMSRDNCLSCHHEKMAIEQGAECANCHATQLEVYSGRALGAGMPDIMYEAELECSQCHTGDESEVVRSDADICIACHGEGYDEILTTWQETTAGLLLQLDALLGRADGMQLSAQQHRLLSRARDIRNLFTVDGSRGVHNSMLAEEYLSEAVGSLEEFLPKS
ncbi:MAG: hypothetical protein FVQ81_08755 [Candidatus Glassbacteria bacterium]|nr:hypothetical protein [Candidatus Glassbacteria bacterium]